MDLEQPPFAYVQVQGAAELSEDPADLVATVALALTTVLSACAPDANQMAAQQNKAKLDHELQHARHDLGIPDSMLKPI